ncbi:MAG: 5'-deoxynucleotidase [Clostridia bacterium]|nr:5'-deoxynucleotidase [Clostridia bacterium]
MSNNFFALIARMKYIERWALMRNTSKENIAEHSFFVSLLAHALACIKRDVFGEECSPDKAASLALLHDASEILTGDMPTPIKYYNPEIRRIYGEIEKTANERLINALPDTLAPAYREMLNVPEEYVPIIKAADKLSALIKCIEEKNSGNAEFARAEESTLASLKAMNLKEADYFIEHFIPAFRLTLDELGE